MKLQGTRVQLRPGRNFPKISGGGGGGSELRCTAQSGSHVHRRAPRGRAVYRTGTACALCPGPGSAPDHAEGGRRGPLGARERSVGPRGPVGPPGPEPESDQGLTTTAMVVAVLAFWHIRVCEDRGLPRQGASWSLGTPAKAGGSGGLSWCLVWSQRPLPLALGRRRVGWQTPQHGLWAWVWGRVQSGSWAPSPSGCLLSGLP